jgi:hypothetical protein
MENSEGYCAHGLASTWPSYLGRLGLGWQPMVKNRGGRGAMARGGTGRIRWLVDGQGGQGGVQEHEEVVGN